MKVKSSVAGEIKPLSTSEDGKQTRILSGPIKSGKLSVKEVRDQSDMIADCSDGGVDYTKSAAISKLEREIIVSMGAHAYTAGISIVLVVDHVQSNISINFEMHFNHRS